MTLLRLLANCLLMLIAMLTGYNRVTELVYRITRFLFQTFIVSKIVPETCKYCLILVNVIYLIIRLLNHFPSLTSIISYLAKYHLAFWFGQCGLPHRFPLQIKLQLAIMIKRYFLSFALTKTFHFAMLNKLLLFLVTSSSTNSNSPNVLLDRRMRVLAFLGSGVVPSLKSSLPILTSLC